MPVDLSALLATQLDALGMAYWIALVAGGGLLVFAAFGGSESDASVDADLDLDLDVDADLDADADAAWKPDLADDADVGGGVRVGQLRDWLSLRFWVFFAALFGVVGVTLTHLTELGTWTVFAAALLGGFAAGQGIQTVMRKIRAGSGNSATEARDYVNRLASVTVAIEDHRTGEVVVQVRGAQRYISAVAPPGQAFAAGDEVVVVGYRAGVAQVIAADRHAD